MAMTSTAKVCRVIGTGQNGTWIFADRVSSRLPATASST